MARLHRLSLLAAAVLLSLSAAGFGSRPAAALSCGILPYMEASLNRTVQRTASREFVDIVGSTLRFRTSATSCIVVQFSAQVMAGDGSVRTMQVRAVRNDGRGDVFNPDGPIQFVVGPSLTRAPSACCCRRCRPAITPCGCSTARATAASSSSRAST